MSNKENEQDTLGCRIKEYEAATTERYFMAGLPLYARLDGRAFHTFTRGFGHPFPALENCDFSFQILMQRICARLVKETNASIGYVQSDEISLGWTDVSKAPFDRREFKLASVMASMAGAALIDIIYNDTCGMDEFKIIREKTRKILPSFDCRVFQIPNLMELANCFVWRENDAIKNSISSYAQAVFPKSALYGKNQSERIKMLKEKGYDWYDLDLETRRGAYYARKVITKKNEKGEDYIRSVVERVFTHERLSKIENKVEYLFAEAKPTYINRSISGGVPRDVKNITISGEIPNDVRNLIADFPEN